MTIEIILLLLVLVVLISIVWSTIKTGISPTQSGTKARHTILELVAEFDTQKPIIDLGSGWGSIVIPLARQYPQRQVIGYELSFFPWLVSILAKYCLGLNNLTLYRRDFLQADLSQASVLLCYLYSGGMVSLADKLAIGGVQQSPHQFTLISNTFALPNAEPIKKLKLKDLYHTPIYVYSWPASNENELVHL